MSISSVYGRRIATYTFNNETYEILQTAEITSISDFDRSGKSLTYEARSIIANIKDIVGLTSGCTTDFGNRQTVAFFNNNINPNSIQRLIKGFVVFKTPVGYHTINLKEFEGISNGVWGVGAEINRQVKLYANGEMPGGVYNPSYDANNWTWLYANLIVHYKRG